MRDLPRVWAAASTGWQQYREGGRITLPAACSPVHHPVNSLILSAMEGWPAHLPKAIQSIRLKSLYHMAE